MDIKVATYVVRDAAGNIDHNATLAKFASDLRMFQANQDLERETLGRVVHGIFDRYPGRRLTTDYIVSEALRALNAQPENFKALTLKVKAYLKGSEFDTVKGPGNGVGRIGDLPVK